MKIVGNSIFLPVTLRPINPFPKVYGYFSTPGKSAIVLGLILLFSSIGVKAQNADSTLLQDSVLLTKNPKYHTTGSIASKTLASRNKDFAEHKTILTQSRNFINLNSEIEKAWDIVSQDFSYNSIRGKITLIYQWKEIAIDGILINRDNIISSRNLTATSILLHELLNRTNQQVQKVYGYHRSLGLAQWRLDSLAADSVLYVVPKDTTALKLYYHKLATLNKNLYPINSALKLSLDSIQKLESQINRLKIRIETKISDVEKNRSEVMSDFSLRPSSNDQTSAYKEKAIRQSISRSWSKAVLLIVFYVLNHSQELLLLVLLIVATYFYLMMLKRRFNSQYILAILHGQNHVLLYPLASSVLIVLTIFQYFLASPPQVFSGLIWIASAILLTPILKKTTSPYFFKVWMVFNGFFILAFFDNLILKYSAYERYGILALSIVGLFTGVFLLLKKQREKIGEPLIVLSIGLMTLLETGAIYYNLAGDYNLSKTLMTNGMFLLIIALLLFWAVRLLSEVLRISSFFFNADAENITRSEKSYGTGMPIYAYLLFFSGWLILVARTNYFFQSITAPFEDFLSNERSIGSFTFTYESIFIFIIVIVISAFISRIVALIAADNLEKPSQLKKSGLGSWLLLIRIAIFAVGLLLAFVSAGIPMDRFAIILGALSVGIGFGLQTLVNNLVSGLIIAFEKPVNVGDIIDVAGQNGTMKSIGIRSSVVTTWDGADLIIPNGDLLNQHLVNWTMGSSRRRFILQVGVAYGTDLEMVVKLLHELMSQDKRILKTPEPIVYAQEFGSSSIDLVLKFWVAHFSIGFDVRSDLVISIDKAFKEKGIVIPFPQLDIHSDLPANNDNLNP